MSKERGFVPNFSRVAEIDRVFLLRGADKKPHLSETGVSSLAYVDAFLNQLEQNPTSISADKVTLYATQLQIRVSQILAQMAPEERGSAKERAEQLGRRAQMLIEGKSDSQPEGVDEDAGDDDGSLEEVRKKMRSMLPSKIGKIYAEAGTLGISLYVAKEALQRVRAEYTRRRAPQTKAEPDKQPVHSEPASTQASVFGSPPLRPADEPSIVAPSPTPSPRPTERKPTPAPIVELEPTVQRAVARLIKDSVHETFNTAKQQRDAVAALLKSQDMTALALDVCLLAKMAASGGYADQQISETWMKVVGQPLPKNNADLEKFSFEQKVALSRKILATIEFFRLQSSDKSLVDFATDFNKNMTIIAGK